MLRHIVGYHRKILYIIIALILGLSFWIASIINHVLISDYHRDVSVRYGEPVLTRQRMDEILEAMLAKEEKNIPEITLWQRDEHAVVENEKKNISVELSVITVAGDMSRIYPFPMVRGGYLAGEDDWGCVIDRATADKLFGSYDVVGLKIKLNNKEYIIRGIIKEPDSHVMIIQEAASYKRSSGMKYSCMEMFFADTDNPKMLAERFVTANGLGTPAKYIDGYPVRWLSYMLIHIPLWLSALLIVIYAVRKVYSLKGSPILIFIGLAGILIISLILIKITNMHIYYPSSMIPNKWSDFDFWTDKFRSIISSVRYKEGGVLYYKDIILRRRMLTVIIGVVISVFSELYVVKSITRVHKYKVDFNDING